MNNVKNQSRLPDNKRQEILNALLEKARELLEPMVDVGQKGKVIINFNGRSHGNVEMSVGFPVSVDLDE